MKQLTPLLAAMLLAVQMSAPVAHAADTPTTAAAPQDALATARALIASDKWLAAIEELKRVNDSTSADWNNLMGYSHRKARTPDYAAAEKYYDAALKINPTHRGALEYSGEMYLMLGDLPRAEQRLAALDKACFLPCEEHTQLKAAVASFKANGNRVVQR